MSVKKRAYVPRVNGGGNFCGHRPDAPRLDLVKPTTDKQRPKILATLQERIRQYFNSPRCIPSLNSANGSKRQQRSERREACLVLMGAVIEHTDLTSLRCGIPTQQGFLSLTLEYLVQYTGLGMRRAERAMADLKKANLLTVKQARQLLEDGSWRGLAAVKAVNRHLFSAFGLEVQLMHEQRKAVERLTNKVAKVGGSIASWARNKMVLGQPSSKRATRSSTPFTGRPAGMDPITYEHAKVEITMALKTAHPNMTAAECNAEAERIIRGKLRA